MENGGCFHSQPVPPWTLSSCVSCEALRMFGRSPGEDQQGDQRPVPVGQHGLFSGCHVCHVSQQRHLRSNKPTPKLPLLPLCHLHSILPDFRSSVQVLIWTQQWLWASVHWAKCPGTDWCRTASPSCWGLTLRRGLFTWCITVTVSSTESTSGQIFSPRYLF